MTAQECEPSASNAALRSIDLGERNLRDLGDTITAATFPNVKELRLDKNFIASLNGVIQLPELEVLSHDTEYSDADLHGEA